MTIQTHIQRIWVVCFSLVGMCSYTQGSHTTTPPTSPISQDLEEQYTHVINHHWHCAHALCVARTAQDTLETISQHCRKHKPSPIEASKLLAYIGLYSVQLMTAWSLVTGIKHWRLLESSLRYSLIAPRYYAHVLQSLYTSHISNSLMQKFLFMYATSDQSRMEDCRVAWDNVYNDTSIWSYIENEISPSTEFHLFYTTSAYLCDSCSHAYWDRDTRTTVLAALAFFHQPVNIQFFCSASTTTPPHIRYLLRTHARSLQRRLHAAHAHLIQDQDL